MRGRGLYIPCTPPVTTPLHKTNENSSKFPQWGKTKEISTDNLCIRSRFNRCMWLHWVEHNPRTVWTGISVADASLLSVWIASLRTVRAYFITLSHMQFHTKARAKANLDTPLPPFLLYAQCWRAKKVAESIMLPSRTYLAYARGQISNLYGF